MFTLDIFASGNVVVYRGNSFTPTEKLTEEEKHFILDKVQEEFFGEYSEEKPMNQEGLEKEINKYNKERFDEYFPEQDGDFLSEVDFMTCLGRVARHFAQWGAEHLADARKTSPEDLEEAADEYEKKHTYQLYDGGGFTTPEYDATPADAFIAGAEWQKDKDTRDMYMSDNRHFNKVYELGKKDMKEMMMKEAVEGEVRHCATVHYVITNESQLSARLKQFQDGDKVRIIIVKEDKS